MFYEVDRHNLIVDLDPAWDDFARANGGAVGATRAAVIGRPLLDFVAGDVARMFVSVALDSARLLERPRVLPYRCDSITRRRRFEMTITPHGQGSLLVDHQLVLDELKPFSRWSPRRTAEGWRCSQCLAVLLQGTQQWIDADKAPSRLPAHQVCGDCARRLFEPDATGAMPD